MQAKVILICGKICCGKSTYAEKLYVENKAVLLSCDEITLALFDGNLGENHDEFVRKTKNFLLKKSVDIVKIGIDVILDWGFWTKEERDHTRNFYQSRNILCEFHYIDISDTIWKSNITKRNNLILSESIPAYFVDASLADKFESIFEKPEKDEIDIWI